MTRDKVRHELLLSVALSQRIVAMAKARKCSKSDLLADMIDSYMNRRWDDQPSERIFTRLDQIYRLMSRTNNETLLVSYCLSRFIRHQLIYAATLPPPGEDARAIGVKRYDHFLNTIASLIARDQRKGDQGSSANTAQQTASHSSAPRSVAD